jgi:hypothetical protein
MIFFKDSDAVDPLTIQKGNEILSRTNLLLIAMDSNGGLTDEIAYQLKASGFLANFAKNSEQHKIVFIDLEVFTIYRHI